MYRIVLIFALNFGVPANAYEVLSTGIFCPETPAGARVDAPGTELGWIRETAHKEQFDVPGTAVPAEADLAFGFYFRIPDDVTSAIGTMILDHPPMGPERVTRQTHSVPLIPGAVQGTSWVFEFDYERVEGTWTRALEVDGEIVLSIDFAVGPAGSNAAVNAICFQSIPIS